MSVDLRPLHEQLAVENAELRVLVEEGLRVVTTTLQVRWGRSRSGVRTRASRAVSLVTIFHTMIEFAQGLPWLVRNRMTGPAMSR